MQRRESNDTREPERDGMALESREIVADRVKNGVLGARKLVNGLSGSEASLIKAAKGKSRLGESGARSGEVRDVAEIGRRLRCGRPFAPNR